jgi:NitT/TauT family transport system permease protein
MPRRPAEEGSDDGPPPQQQRRVVGPPGCAVAPWLLAVLALLAGLVVRRGARPAAAVPAADPGRRAGSWPRRLLSPAFWPACGITFAEAVGGSVLGAAVALPMAIAIHRSRC